MAFSAKSQVSFPPTMRETESHVEFLSFAISDLKEG